MSKLGGHEGHRVHLRFSSPISMILLILLAQTSIGAHTAATASPAGTHPPGPVIEKWPLAISLGGGPNTSGHLTGEATFLLDLPGPYVSVGYGTTRAGGRFYAEGGIALLVSLAAGVGYHPDSSGASHWGYHLFAGVPIPIVGVGRDGASTPFGSAIHIAPVLLYVDPFYRPEFRKGEAVQHEVGVLLKVRIGITKRQWSTPGLNVIDGFTGIHDL